VGRHFSQAVTSQLKLRVAGLNDDGDLTVDIEISDIGAVKLLKLTGRLTLGDAVDKLRASMDDLLNSGATHFVMDLSDVAMIDSSGIGLIVRYMTAAKQKGGALKLLNPTKFALQTLKMIGLLNRFEVFQDQGEAVASFK
jgi:anti-sigma B factor antagonist